SHLHYALGEVYDDCGNYGAAFAHWMIANSIRAIRSGDFNVTEKKAGAIARCRVFTQERIAELSEFGCQEKVLVCVVGMPRSGTTLIEQILGSHPHARPLGERGDFFRLTQTLPKTLQTKSRYPECCQKMTASQIGDLWRKVLDRMRRSAGPCTLMITKLP